MRRSQNLRKKSPNSFDIYSVLSKQLGIFFIIFVAFSENLNFMTTVVEHNEAQVINNTIDCVRAV